MWFEVDSDSGTVSLIAPLDYERNRKVGLLFIHLSHIKLKASWATYINWLLLTWDHHIPHSYGHRHASNVQHTNDGLLTRLKLC